MDQPIRINRRSFLDLAVPAVLFAPAGVRHVLAAEPDFQPLFTGADLTGWRVPRPNPFWKAVHGILVGENDEKRRGNVLYTERKYKDFIFQLDARWQGDIDSGIMLRKPRLQMQIGISRSLRRDMTCSFYTGGKEKYPESGQAKHLEGVLKPADWNTIRLQAKGDTFTVWLNGKQVSQYTNAKYKDAAPIGLQLHPGVNMRIEFRNIKIKVLD